jgi:hypothetical protein
MPDEGRDGVVGGCPDAAFPVSAGWIVAGLVCGERRESAVTRLLILENLCRPDHASLTGARLAFTQTNNAGSDSSSLEMMTETVSNPPLTLDVLVTAPASSVQVDRSVEYQTEYLKPDATVKVWSNGTTVLSSGEEVGNRDGHGVLDDAGRRLVTAGAVAVAGSGDHPYGFVVEFE